MRKKIAVLPGDGVGPEVTKQAVRVQQAIAKKFNHNFIFEYGLIGAEAINKTGDPLPIQTLTLCKYADAILFGAIGDPIYDNNPQSLIRPEQGLLRLRKILKLFANIRPVKVYRALLENSPIKEERIKNVDLVVVRELTGGIYFGKPRGRLKHNSIAIDTAVYSKKEIERIAKVAFELALKRKKKIVSVDKANVLETSRLWRETVTQTAFKYPEIELTHMFVDNAAMQLIKRPAEFDVILTENMFGDILTDEASVISGSIGLLPSASIGEKYALYEPIHGAYNKATGRNTANPLGAILSAALMLRHSFQLEREATLIERTVEKVISLDYRTQDIAINSTIQNKILGTKEMGDKIISIIVS